MLKEGPSTLICLLGPRWGKHENKTRVLPLPLITVQPMLPGLAQIHEMAANQLSPSAYVRKSSDGLTSSLGNFLERL